MYTSRSSASRASKVKCDWCHAEILLLLELVLQSGEEFRVNLACELFDIVNRLLEVLLFIAGPLFHLEVPGVNFLDSLRTQNERGGGDLRIGMLQQERVEERDLTQVLREEEDLIVRGRVRKLAVTLQKTIDWRCLKVELKCGQYAELHLQDVFLGEFVLCNMQKILKLRWVNLFIFSGHK